MFAGFGTAPDTNRRFHELLDAGGDGLSTAFDLPTLMGRDSDDPLALGEVGKCGVAIDTLADVEDLYRGIDIGAVTTSMTINGPGRDPARDVRRQRGAQRHAARQARRHAPERHPQGVPGAEGVHLPAPPVDAASSPTRSGSAKPRCRAGTRSRSPATTSARPGAPPRRSSRSRSRTASRTSSSAQAAGLDVDRFAPRLSFFFNAHLDFFEEIAKYRAARRIWARWMRDRYGAAAGARAAAALPHADRGRVAHRAAARGQHRAHRDRGARGRARRHAEPAHQLDGRDAGAADREGGAHRAAHPAGDRATRPGSRTSPTRSAARTTSRRSPTTSRPAPKQCSRTSTSSATDRCSKAASRAVEDGWFQGEIADSAYELERKLNRGDHIVVGVNAFLEGNDEPPPPTLRIGPEVEDQQLKRLAEVKADRDDDARRRRARTRCAPTRRSRRPT